MSTPLFKGEKKLINSWAMYDWANSVYSLTIATAVFPLYFESATKSKIFIFGREYINTVVYTYALSFAFLVVAFISPTLSSIADFRRNKLLFMKFFCYLGSASCIGLYFFTGENIALGLGLTILAAIGFTGSLVFYNAYLPQIADESLQDKVSARGFALGYIGSVLLLLVNLAMIEKPEWFGLSGAGMASRISCLTVGMWWAGFAQITFSALHRFEKGDPSYGKKMENVGSIFGGYIELKKVLKQLRHLPKLTTFLIAFLFYSMALQTVLYVAPLFGKQELKLDSGLLILVVLILQLVAIAGAYFFAYLSGKIGNFKALIIGVFIWIGVCIGAYYTQNATQFIILAFFVGTIMGGVQSLSRSTYSKMLPETEDHASFFSFFDVTEKIAIVIGTLSYATIEEITGGMRSSVIALTLFFTIGLLILIVLRNHKIEDPIKEKSVR